MRLVPRTLTGRLVVTAIALVALVTVLMAVVTTLAMSQNLASRLDQQLTSTQQRALRPGGGRQPTPGGGGHGGVRRPYELGTLLVDLNGPSGEGGVLTDDGNNGALESLDEFALASLRKVPADGEPTTVSLGKRGDYRVVVDQDADGDTLAVGLSLRDVQSTTQTLLVRSLLLALAGVALAGLIGTFLVRRQLRPLREVADTAYEVTAMPLGAGGQTIYECAVPVIAAVNGHCLGGGVGLVGNADCIVASDDAYFGVPEVDRGALGAATHLARLVPPHLMRTLYFTGRKVTAQDLVPHGSVLEVVTRDRLDDAALAVATEIARKDTRVIRMAKEAINGIDVVDVNRSYRYEQGFTMELNLLGVSDGHRDAFISEQGAGKAARG